jgi:hypothetical protein
MSENVGNVGEVGVHSLHTDDAIRGALDRKFAGGGVLSAVSDVFSGRQKYNGSTRAD